MTVRFYISMVYGFAALGIAAFSHLQAGTAGAGEPLAHAVMVHVDDAVRARLGEIEPGLTGHAEIDDLPAYLTEAVHADD